MFSALIGVASLAVLLQAVWAGIFLEHDGERDKAKTWISIHNVGGIVALTLAILALVVCVMKLRARKDLVIGSAVLAILLLIEYALGHADSRQEQGRPDRHPCASCDGHHGRRGVAPPSREVRSQLGRLIVRGFRAVVPGLPLGSRRVVSFRAPGDRSGRSGRGLSRRRRGRQRFRVLGLAATISGGSGGGAIAWSPRLRWAPLHAGPLPLHHPAKASTGRHPASIGRREQAPGRAA